MIPPRVLFASLACLLAAAAEAGAASPPAGSRMLASSPGETRFEVGFPDYRIETPQDAGPGRVAWAGEPLESEGPALPARLYRVAVPPQGEVTLSAVGREADAREAVRLAGPLTAADVESAREARGAPPAAPRSTAALDGPQARLLGITWMRNQRVALVEITPFAYDGERSRLTAYPRVEVSLACAGGIAPQTPAEDPDPFEPVYRGALVNYEQGRAWRRRAGPVSATGVAAADTGIFAGRPWLRMGIATTGLYRVDGARIAAAVPGFPIGTVSVDSLRVFVWPGRPVLFEDTVCVDCDYAEVAIAVVGDGDAVFESGESIEFWAVGPSDWSDLYPGVVGDSSFFNNPYSTRHYYWFTWGTPSLPVGGTPRRMTTLDAPPSGLGTTPAYHPARIHLEEDREYSGNNFDFLAGLERFVWVSLGYNQTLTFRARTPGAVDTLPARLLARFWGGTTSTHQLDLRLNGQAYRTRSWAGIRSTVLDSLGPVHDGEDTLTASIPPTAQTSDRSAMAWWELYYSRRFEPVRDTLFFLGTGGGLTTYDVRPFAATTPPRILDVADPLQPVQITMAEWADVPGGGGNKYVRFEVDEASPRRYWIAPDGAIALVPQTELKFFAAAPNLRSAANAADYVVIYYDADGNASGGFDAAANLIAAHRRTNLELAGKLPPYAVLALPASRIYNQFSGGRAEPAAIRNFMQSAVFGSWQVKPAYALLMGDASYDFKNLRGLALPGQPACLLPSYENLVVQDRGVYYGYASDDWVFDGDADVRIQPDVYGGRIPAGDPASALTVLRDKVIPYETDRDLSEWRNRALLIADDFDRPSPPYVDCIPHLAQTTALDTLHLPAVMERERVLMHVYPFGTGYAKPQARADLKEAIESGVLLMNYIGHGGPFQLADEKVLLNSDAETFGNRRRPNVFVAASCDVGKFDDPTVNSLGERLLMLGKGGSVAVLSATELAFSQANVALADSFYMALFERDAAAPLYSRTLGAALVTAKARLPAGFVDNMHRFALMGDPASPVAAPRFWADVALEDPQGQPLATVQRGQTVVARGTLRAFPGGPTLPMDGVASLLVEDSAPYDSVTAPSLCGTPPPTFHYYFTAAPLFRGDVTVTGGQFTARFLVAGDARVGPFGRVRAYFRGRVPGAPADSDGVGDVRMAVSPGTLPTGDTQGPTIGLGFPGGATQVRPNAVLRVDLFDPSGIMLTGHNPANNIFVTVDGNTTQRTDITPSFRYVNNSFQQGVAYFPIGNLSAGEHEITVNAADNLAVGVQASQHRSKASIRFTVTDNPELTILRTFAFPNPLRSGFPARIVVDAKGDSVNCLIRIYTVSGRLVRTLRSFGALGQIQVPWDGLDAEGQALANGVYLYRAQINGRESDGKSSARQAAVAEGRIVVVR